MNVFTRRGATRPRAPAPGVFAFSLLLASCTPSGTSPLLNENEIAARTVMSLWETGEVEDLAHLFYSDAVYDDFPNQTQYRGLEEIAGYFRQVHDWADAASLSVSAVHASETGAVVEWVFSAVQDKPIGTMVAVSTGRDVFLNGVTVLEIDGGRIRRAADYIDMLPMVLQIGAEVHMPGGSVMKYDLAPLSEIRDGTDAADDPGYVPEGNR